MTEWTPALDTCLSSFWTETAADDDPIDWFDMPPTAEKRAEKTRRGLRTLWLEHVKNTPHEGRKHMFDLVKKGLCLKFEWWDRVTHNAPFESKSIDDPVVSKRVYAHVASELQSR